MKSSIVIIFICCLSLNSYCQEKSNNPDDSTHSFNFILKFGVANKNIINTFNHTFTKDLVMGPDTTISLYLSELELDTIKAEMERIHILDYPKIFTPPWRDNPNVYDMTVFPNSSYYLKIQFGNQIKEVSWDDSNDSKINIAKKLRGIISKIIKIIVNKEEYKKLPNSRAAYQ